MKIDSVEPGDVEIRGIKLSKWTSQSNLPIDLMSQAVSISIYEDIEEPSMILEIIMIDSLNLVQDYPIVGEEIIEIGFNTPGRDGQFKKKFFIYSIDGTGVSPNSKSSIYTIKAVTPLHYFSSGSSVSKSYNTTADEIVKDIINTESQKGLIGTVKLHTEKTKGILPITIPNLTALQSIDYIRQKAVSAQYPSGGSYVFFENQYGYQFRSIEDILKEGKKQIGSKVFTYAPDTLSDKQRRKFTFRNILRYNHISKFDSISKVNNGVLNNVVKSFDVLTKQTEDVNFKLSENARNFMSTDNRSSLPNSNKFFNKFQNNGTSYFVPKDSSRDPDYVDSTMGYKSSYSMLLNENIVRILIHGDSYLCAGDLIELNLPEVSGTTEKKTKDRMNSGNYLITKLRHILTIGNEGKPKHQIALDCLRMGYK